MSAPWKGLWRSAGMRHSLTMSAAMLLAGGMDYAVNVLAGRSLEPLEFGTFVSVAAILQILVYLSNAIRSVVAFCTAGLSVEEDSINRVGAFVRRAWRWAWQRGLVATALALLLSPVVARLLRLPDARPRVFSPA
jgi:hypothetical protein